MKAQAFLAYAAKLEHEAACLYGQAVVILTASRDEDGAAFFSEMNGYARTHLAEVLSKGGYEDISDVPNIEVSESFPTAAEALQPMPHWGESLGLDGAVEGALLAERRAVAFYDAVAESSDDPDVRAWASEFAKDEREHVVALERFLGVAPY